MARIPCDLLVAGATELWTLDCDQAGGPSPSQLADFAAIPQGAVAVAKGRVVAVGPQASLRSTWRAAETMELDGGVLVPGLIDAHTHPAFAATREVEFEQRSQGLSYLEIAEQGGGILSSVRAVRQASEEELTAQVAAHFRAMQAHGTAACEAKSGYGLTVADELKSLRAIHSAAATTGMVVFPTFLGAHAVPKEHRDHPDAWLDCLCEEALPAVAEAGLARAADVFVEGHAFSLARAEKYLVRAAELGFALRVHVDQFENLGGTEMAVGLGAESVDHLEVLSDAGLDALATSGQTVAGLLPAVPHFLRQQEDAPGKKLLRLGVRCFVASDFNPGSSLISNLVEVAHFARIRQRLSPLEALAGMTIWAAASLQADAEWGRIAVGARARFTHLEIPSLEHFGYRLGESPGRLIRADKDAVSG